MQYQILKFFDEETLNNIHSELSTSIWESGTKTFSNFETANLYKKNLQTSINNQLIFNSLDTNEEFLDFTVAEKTSGLLISKTISGGFYKPHFDLTTSHFSTTIFLNDPFDYDGGELCLLIDNEEKKFKLNPGHGIVYETGITHRVNEVTRGERLACVFWTRSFIRDMEDLKRYRYYRMMQSRYEEKIYDTCYDFHYDLNSIFTRKCNEIMKKWMVD